MNGIFIRQVKHGKVMREWQSTDLLGYSVFVGLFNVEQKRPVRNPALLPATAQ